MKKTLILLVSSLFCYTLSLQAQGVSYNQEFQVNTNTNFNQGLPSISYLINGGFVLCWNSDLENGNNNGIFGQIFNNDGSKLGTEFQVNTYTNLDQSFLDVSCLLEGGFVVCFESYDQDGSLCGIYGQLFNNDGTKRGSEFQVNTYTDNFQQHPSVSYLLNGGFVVCWESNGQDGSYDGIYGQLFNSDGSKQGSEFQVNTYSYDSQGSPSVSQLADEGFVVCWHSFFQNGSSCGIYGQLFNNDGSKRGSEFQVNTYINRDQYDPSVSFLSDGGFVVCWIGFGQDDGISEIYGQLFNNDGSKRGNEFQMNTYTDYIQEYPSVGYLLNGEFVVCWGSWNQDGSGVGIYGQLFNSNGFKRGAEFRINSYTNSHQDGPKIGSLTNGRFVVCWNSLYQDGSGCGVFGKYYLPEEIDHPLISFSLIEPANDISLTIIPTSFKWDHATSIHINFPWELEYYLYLDENDNFSSPRIIKAIYDTTCIVDSLTPGTTYYWKILAKNIGGDSLWSSETNGFFISHDAITSIEESMSEEPNNFKLFTNYPNPFNPETNIKYALPADQAFYDVKIKIYDALGSLVVVLKNEQQKPGIYTVKWNGQNAAGQSMPTGVYFCIVQVGPHKAVQKMLMVQ